MQGTEWQIEYFKCGHILTILSSNTQYHRSVGKSSEKSRRKTEFFSFFFCLNRVRYAENAL